jgi:hypothetical protein
MEKFTDFYKESMSRWEEEETKKLEHKEREVKIVAT